jgi:hypothetical protein
MQILPDCTIAYGQSDEYSFVLRPDTTVHGRRRQKLVSLAVSKFTAVYQFYWAHFFPDTGWDRKCQLEVFLLTEFGALAPKGKTVLPLGKLCSTHLHLMDAWSSTHLRKY